eukprot:gene6913-9466_t
MLQRFGEIIHHNRSSILHKRLNISSSAYLSSSSSSNAVKNQKTKEKPVIVVIGTGWAGYRVALELDKSKYVVQVVSPINHFLFTPLLPSTAVGTLEFRAIQEPVRTIPNISYFQAFANKIDFENQTIMCTNAHPNQSNKEITLKYDILVLAPGCEVNTFNVKGVVDNPDHVFFLKKLSDSRNIRNRLIDCFERASSPGVDPQEMERLLTFVVVGGGPTNVEFAAELYDFIKTDVSRWYPDIFHLAKIKIIEASGHILGSFKSNLVNYVEKLYASRRVEIITETTVKEVQGKVAILSSGSEIPFGLMVWSTGIKQIPMIQNIPNTDIAKLPNGRLALDPFLRLLKDSKNNKPVGKGDVFALGDCAADQIKPLPQLAQVASQQGMYLAKTLNSSSLSEINEGKANPFKYQHLGSMASVGEWKGVYDSSNIDPAANNDNSMRPPAVQGFLAFILWRAAYWTKQVSLSNKMLILMFWFKSTVFGRDISRF